MANVAKQLADLWSNQTVADLQNNAEIKQKISINQLTEVLNKLLEHKQIVDLNEAKLALLETTYNLKNCKNSEIMFRFLRLCIRAKQMNRFDQIIAFADSNFRMKFCRPIYRDLGQWPEVKPMAVEHFEKIRNQMMTVCAHTIAKDLGLK